MKKFFGTLVMLFLLYSGVEVQANGYVYSDMHGNVKRVSATDNAVYQMAQKCVVIQSPGTGKFLRKNSSDANSLYSFQDTSARGAAQFYLKPAALGTYLLTDQDGRFLASLAPSRERAAGIPSMATEWQLSARAADGNSFQFKLENRFTRFPVQHEYWVTHSRLWGRIKTKELKIEQYFNLVEQNHCRAYPEIDLNVSGDRNQLKGNVKKAVRGFIDAHAHITSNEFMGGKFIHGEIFHRWGVPYALNDSKISHGPNGSMDMIGNIYTYENPIHRYDTRGWPDFPWWPNATQMTHTGYYYKWMERAWLSGQRMLVTYLVENESLCTVQKCNPIAQLDRRTCNEMDSIRLQMKRMLEMQDYIDAQSGGPGRGFFRIVTSPQQARRVIADGKLAVFIGVETSELFNCSGKKEACTTSSIDQGLIELYNLGIRSLYVVHKFDNQFAGAILEESIINVGQAMSNGSYYKSKECNPDTAGRKMDGVYSLTSKLPFMPFLLGQIGVYPNYDQRIEHHCNVRGLSPLGVYLVNRMMDMGMLIDIDHLSADSVTHVMDIAEARNYSGVVSTHSYTHRDREGKLHRNFHRMLRLGGFASHMNNSAKNIIELVGEYLGAVEHTSNSFVRGVGLGLDMGGLCPQAKPREDVAAFFLRYPFTTEFGLTFDRQVSGNRIFDYNKDGVAHYGMLADHVEDMRVQGKRLSEDMTDRVYQALMNSAEAFLQMWERAESNRNRQYVNPL